MGTAVFAGTLFLSATLLFWVQPLMARLLLPLLGGAPAVWNACMVFFQALLLAGYLYAHATVRWLGERRQPLLHLALLLVPLPFLPLALDAERVRAFAGAPNPTLPLLGLYLPLRWAWTNDARAVRRALKRAPTDPLLVEFLARRAVSNFPYDKLLAVSPQPFRDLEEGRYDLLAGLELDRLGIRNASA